MAENPKETQDQKSARIPPELLKFLERKGAALVIRGAAGSGKTSLMYGIMDHFREHEIVLWTSHPISEGKHARYPFIREKCVLGKETVERSLALQKIFEHVQKVPQDRRIFIFMDNVERLVSRYLSIRETPGKTGHEIESLVQNIDNDFVSGRGACLVMTSEDVEGSALTHIAGGCVNLHRKTLLGGAYREFEICKLEETGTSHLTYLFTLTGGDLAYIPHEEHRHVYTAPAKMEPKPLTKDIAPSGNSALDKLLGGGYRFGSFNLFEVYPEVPEWVYLSLCYPTIYNFTYHGHGTILSLAGSQTPSRIRENIAPVVGEDRFTSLVRVLTPFTQPTRLQYVLSAHSESSKERLNIWKNAVSQLRSATGNKPVLDVTSFSAIENTFERSGLLQMVDEGIKRINYEGDIGIGIVRSGRGIAESLVNISDTHFRVIEIDGAYVIQGIKPKVDLNVVSFQKAFPEFDLKPIV